MATGTNGIATINELKSTGVWKFQNTNSLQIGFYTDGAKCPTLSEMQACDDTTNYNITYPSGYSTNQLVPFDKINYSRVVKYSTLTIQHNNSNVSGSFIEYNPVITTSILNSASDYYNGTIIPIDTYEQYTPNLIIKVDQTKWPTVSNAVYVSYIYTVYNYSSSTSSNYVCYAYLTKAQIDSLRSGTNVSVPGYVNALN